MIFSSFCSNSIQIRSPAYWIQTQARGGRFFRNCAASPTYCFKSKKFDPFFGRRLVTVYNKAGLDRGWDEHSNQVCYYRSDSVYARLCSGLTRGGSAAKWGRARPLCGANCTPMLFLYTLLTQRLRRVWQSLHQRRQQPRSGPCPHCR